MGWLVAAEAAGSVVCSFAEEVPWLRGTPHAEEKPLPAEAKLSFPAVVAAAVVIAVVVIAAVASAAVIATVGGSCNSIHSTLREPRAPLLPSALGSCGAG